MKKDKQIIIDLLEVLESLFEIGDIIPIGNKNNNNSKQIITRKGSAYKN